MNSAVYTASAEEGIVCGVHDAINLKFGDVMVNDRDRVIKILGGLKFRGTWTENSLAVQSSHGGNFSQSNVWTTRHDVEDRRW